MENDSEAHSAPVKIEALDEALSDCQAVPPSPQLAFHLMVPESGCGNLDLPPSPPPLPLVFESMACPETHDEPSIEMAPPVHQITDEPPLKKPRNIHQKPDQSTEACKTEVETEIDPHGEEQMEARQINLNYSNGEVSDRSPAEMAPQGSVPRNFETQAPSGSDTIVSTAQRGMMTEDTPLGAGDTAAASAQGDFHHIQQMSSDEEMDEMMNNIRYAAFNTINWYWNAMQMCFADWKEVRSDRPMTGKEWITNILEGHPQRCHDCFHMNKEHFLVLCDEVKQKGIITERDVTIEKQVGMFLHIVAHSDHMRKVGEDFQHSTKTVWRCFKNVLRSILRMRVDYIKLPGSDAPIHPKVSEGTQHAPFKDALGAIDGMHIPAFVDPDEDNKERFLNRKKVYSQNVMAVVDFDGNFLAVVAGWEGSANDNLILRKALEDGFVVPPNKYYLVDKGYTNTKQFLSPYRGRPYHLVAFEKQSQTPNQYECPEDLFNHRHAQLRNIVEKTFGILKNRFKICERVHEYKYKFKIQVRIVIACCILHNFINYRNRLPQVSDEEGFDRVVQNDISVGDNSIKGYVGANDREVGDGLREVIKNIFVGYLVRQDL